MAPLPARSGRVPCRRPRARVRCAPVRLAIATPASLRVVLRFAIPASPHRYPTATWRTIFSASTRSNASGVLWVTSRISAITRTSFPRRCRRPLHAAVNPASYETLKSRFSFHESWAAFAAIFSLMLAAIILPCSFSSFSLCASST